ncbi:MAG: LamB/YcsF family protein, partial [Dehalococcoidia bacterium]|nr:LamB/YcsF family protein [Dehalococcoidia bacterium]
MASVIDFNCDLGESFGSWKLGLDEEVVKHVTSVNVAT